MEKSNLHYWKRERKELVFSIILCEGERRPLLYDTLKGSKVQVCRQKIIALESTNVELYSQIRALEYKCHTLDIRHHGN